jgi:uncharacterized protein (DUF983 family)
MAARRSKPEMLHFERMPHAIREEGPTVACPGCGLKRNREFALKVPVCSACGVEYRERVVEPAPLAPTPTPVALDAGKVRTLFLEATE